MMNDESAKSGWVRMHNGFDIELKHGVPIRVSDNGLDLPHDTSELTNEITRLTGLPVIIGSWQACEYPGEQEAVLHIECSQFKEVLRRLALASAAIYVDRFQKAIDADVVDWDSAEYSSDFNDALERCELARSQISKQDYFDFYTQTMHEESQRLAESGTSPIVDNL